LQLRALLIQNAVLKYQAIAVEPGNSKIGVRARSFCRAQKITLSQRVNGGVAPVFGLARRKTQRCQLFEAVLAQRLQPVQGLSLKLGLGAGGLDTTSFKSLFCLASHLRRQWAARTVIRYSRALLAPVPVH